MPGLIHHYRFAFAAALVALAVMTFLAIEFSARGDELWEKSRRVQDSMTTQEVLEILGKPSYWHSTRAGQAGVWVTQDTVVQVTFDRSDGKVVSWYAHPRNASILSRWR